MSTNKNMKKAKEIKNDEWYTQFSDIENEISEHIDYRKFFKDKIVLCNCDDPEYSNFFKFFTVYFNTLNLKKLITTHYNKDNSPSYKLEWEGEKIQGEMVNLIKTPLKQNGDFRSDECIELLEQSDIVCTNPPFSLFKDFFNQLIEYKKDFVIIAEKNKITYKDVFPCFKSGQVWFGYTKPSGFMIPPNMEISYAQKGKIRWFTSFKLDRTNKKYDLKKLYYGNESHYPKFDNYDAINIDKIVDIPKDYYGVMAVTASTFFDVYCPEQFEIVSLPGTLNDGMIKNAEGKIGNRITYARILIRRKDGMNEN